MLDCFYQAAPACLLSTNVANWLQWEHTCLLKQLLYLYILSELLFRVFVDACDVVQHALLQRVAGPQQGMLVCIMDNRGVGNSSSPVSKQAYSTQLMTRDALAVMVSPPVLQLPAFRACDYAAVCCCQLYCATRSSTDLSCVCPAVDSRGTCHDG